MTSPTEPTPDNNAPQGALPDDRALQEWAHRLTQALQILDLTIDDARLLDLARRASHEAGDAAGPITTFVVGYAAGLAATSGEREVSAAVDTAIETALRAVEHGISDEAPASDGWPGTAQ